MFTVAAGLAADSRQAAEFFEMMVRPVLANNCYTCHTQSKMGGLDLTSRESLLRGGNSGPAIRPGDPENSLLVQVVNLTHERLTMPPSGKLPDAKIEVLTEWVRSGAVWPEHPKTAAAEGSFRITPEQRAWWAFQPVRKPNPPAVKNASWATSAIDRFVLARLEQNNLRPVEPADRRTLIRRASYDLTGLPPTPGEMEPFSTSLRPRYSAKATFPKRDGCDAFV
ncbi:MAG: DUF1549 domain-containing protein, partial [bacterium]|nr:DUF1549 domain-containing protein [bacterium]